MQWPENNSSDSSHSSSGRSDSDGSYHSKSTAPTEYSYRPKPVRNQTCYGRVEGHLEEFSDYRGHHDPLDCDDPRTSVDTYASSSEEELELEDDYPEYEVPAYTQEVMPTDAIPTTPKDFSDLFPSSRKLYIRHDDSTLDGNMNLRVDTQAGTSSGTKQNFILFHLRMHDLRNREFSLRRYCRESGREVCHSIRKYQKSPADKMPALQKSFSSVFATLRHKTDARPSTASGLKRSDSGYDSLHGIDEDGERVEQASHLKNHSSLPTNTIKLEFSNYAHVDVKRRGARSHKRYLFEYWGMNYTWRRLSKRDGDTEMVSYHLFAGDSDQKLACIVPMRLTPAQAREETARGGWIPPCYMRICDEKLTKAGQDVSDVVIASGLMALADDWIKRRFHSKQTTQLHIPLTKSASFKLNMEYVGPKRLIDEVFHRSPRSATSSRQPALLRKAATGS